MVWWHSLKQTSNCTSSTCSIKSDFTNCANDRQVYLNNRLKRHQKSLNRGHPFVRWVWLPAGSHVDIFVQFKLPPSALPPPTSLSLFTWFHILLLAYVFWPQQQCWCKRMRCALRTVASCIFQRSPWIQEHFEVPLIDLALWSEGRLRSRRWKEKERETSWKTDRKQAGQLTSLCSAGEKLFCSST